MKIVVIYYKETTEEKTEKEVVADIIEFYSKADELLRQELGSILRKQLGELSISAGAEIEFVDTNDNSKRVHLLEMLKTINIDLLVTYNLAGFENCTLTDGLALNLVDCRQLHVVEKDNLPNDKYLIKDKSINMFFHRK